MKQEFRNIILAQKCLQTDKLSLIMFESIHIHITQRSVSLKIGAGKCYFKEERQE